MPATNSSDTSSTLDTSSGSTTVATSLTETSEVSSTATTIIPTSTGETADPLDESTTEMTDTTDTTGMDGAGSSSDTTIGPMLMDADGDGVPDSDDNCPDVSNPGQENLDGDIAGDVCDSDVDGDGVFDPFDNCVGLYNADQADLDGDFWGDLCDDDDDNDGAKDVTDNCPLVVNPDQKDVEMDGVGDACDADSDNDGIPDAGDPFPNNAQLPGKTTPGFMYGHTSSQLYSISTGTLEVKHIAALSYGADGCNHSMTDVAIDQHGVLYGITFNCAYTVHPQTGKATRLGTLPQSFNGLTLVPAGVVEPGKDSLIGISNAGGWYHLTLVDGKFSAKQLGSYGGGYTSAGDAFSIVGVGTYAAVNKDGNNSVTYIVSVNPKTGKVTGQLATLNGFSAVYGLAGWQNLILAFNAGGELIKVDPKTKAVNVVADKNVAWWGAGVGTVIPQ